VRLGRGARRGAGRKRGTGRARERGEGTKGGGSSVAVLRHSTNHLYLSMKKTELQKHARLTPSVEWMSTLSPTSPASSMKA
jgi:hypothetical protein